MTVNNLVSVVKPSLFSTRKLRLPRRLFWDWNVSNVRPEPNWPWRDASTSNWVVKRSKRVKLCNSESCYCLLFYYIFIVILWPLTFCKFCILNSLILKTCLFGVIFHPAFEPVVNVRVGNHNKLTRHVGVRTETQHCYKSTLLRTSKNKYV